MKPKLTLLQLLLAVLPVCFSFQADAQSPFVEDAYASMIEDTLQPGVFAGTFTVTFSDTAVSQIEIKLGTSAWTGDIALETFNYDQTAGLPAGRSYSRKGRTAELGIGNFPEKNTYFGQARIKDTSGNWSAPFQFIFN